MHLASRNVERLFFQIAKLILLTLRSSKISLVKLSRLQHRTSQMPAQHPLFKNAQQQYKLVRIYRSSDSNDRSPLSGHHRDEYSQCNNNRSLESLWRRQWPKASPRAGIIWSFVYASIAIHIYGLLDVCHRELMLILVINTTNLFTSYTFVAIGAILDGSVGGLAVFNGVIHA